MTQKKRGRPRKADPVKSNNSFYVALPDEEAIQIRRMADDQDRTVSSVIRRLVRAELGKKEKMKRWNFERNLLEETSEKPRSFYGVEKIPPRRHYPYRECKWHSGSWCVYDIDCEVCRYHPRN